MLRSKVNINQVLNKIAGNRVIMRADFNVPLRQGVITNNKRIVDTIPTIKTILEQGPRALILMSHLGRPKGQAKREFSLEPIVPELETHLGRKVTFLNDCVGAEVHSVCQNAQDGEIILLENLRFHLEEEGKGLDANGNKVKADPEAVKEFRAELTNLADVYINDAFGTAHRDHSSMTGVDLPVRAAGLLLKKEIDYFAKALEDPDHPFLVILGGAKIHDKIQLINNLLDRVNDMIIGGGMAFTFLKEIHGIDIGNSLYDEEGARAVPDIMRKAEDLGVNISLPTDFLIGDLAVPDAQPSLGDLETGIPEGLLGLDVGPQTIQENDRIIRKSKTIVWNGPQGMFENPHYRPGSESLVYSLIEASNGGATTIVGGGDSVTMAQTVLGAEEALDHLSTGGGASLELLEGKQLPGIVALSNIDDI